MIKNIIKKLINKFGYEIKKKSKKSESKPQKNTEVILKRLYENYKKQDPLKLHFGCGPRILKNWINIDLSFEPYKKYLKYYTNKFYPKSIRGNRSDLCAIDVTKTRLPLPNNSVDVIFHEDFIEHLNQQGQIIFIAETFRVLKKGGIHRINTPNLITSMQENSDFTKGFEGVYSDEWKKHKHLNVLTKKMLEEIAKTVRYSKVIFNNRDKSISNLIPLEYRPTPGSKDRAQGGNIFADLIK